MLVKNPVTRFLYTMGYNGINNIYEYWLDHMNEIRDTYYNQSKSRNPEEDLQSFAYKVRWSSHQGLYLRFEMDRFVRSNKGDLLDFEQLVIKSGGKPFGLVDFNQFSFDNDLSSRQVDFR